MANYYVDKNGDITLGKKKKKFEDNDIAPVKTPAKTKASAQKNNDVAPSWFEKGALADGYDFGDITKTILGTGQDVATNALTGVLGMGEKVVDAVGLGVAKVAQGAEDRSALEHAARSAGGMALNPMLGLVNIASAVAASKGYDLSEGAKEFVAKDLYDEKKVASWMMDHSYTPSDILYKGVGADRETTSVLGDKSDSLVQSAGELGATMALSYAGVPWWATTALTSFGGEAENALNQGATVDEAAWSAAITTGAELLTEKISGGIKFPGMGTLDDGLTKLLARNVSNKAVRTLAKLGIDVVGEGGEEVLSGLMSAIGQKLTYADEQELNELFSLEDAWDSFVGGAVLGGAGGTVQAVNAKAKGVDYTSELTANEEAVVKKLYEAELAEAEKNGKKVNKNKLWDSIVKQMDRGEISIDTIEEVLGGDEFTAYKSLVDEQNAHLKDLAKMFEGDELKAQQDNYLSDSKRDELKSQLRKSVFGKVITDNGSRLLNSYAETEARGVKFTANVDDYEGEYAKKTIQNIIDAESGNNTRLMHELADLLAKTSEDKKTVFSITDAKKLARTSFAFKDQTTDGYVVRDADGVVKEVVINLDSPKYLNRVVGHEVTHILEGTEFYDTFRGVVEEYAKSKGEYDTRLADTIRRYSDKDGYKGQAGLENIKKEVVADLVGDYIFSDAEFVKNLSVSNRNIFEKVYDEIKYFCKVAKAGSKEEKQLLKVKKAFEDAYRAEGVKKTDAASGRQLSVSDGSDVERTIYIKDGHTESGETVSFIDLILDGKKKGETRTHKSLTRKWVGIAKDGLVYGRVRLGEPYLIGKDSPEYQYSFIEGTEYDLKDNEQKYYYPIEEIEDFRDNPKPIVSNGNYGTYQYSVPDADTLTEAGKGKDIEVVGGVAVASNVADVLKSPEYKKPKDYMVSYSVSSTPAWEKSYLEQHHSANDLKVVDAVRSFTEKMVQDDAVRGYVPMGEYRYTKMGPLRSNMEYIVSFDMDTSCPRTFQFLNFRDAIQRRAGRYLTYNESINLLELMRAYGQQIPCCYCYVENKRVLLSASYNNFFGFRNAVLNAETDAEAEKLMYGYDAKKGLPEASRKAFERWRSDRAYNPSLTDVWTATNTARNSVLNFLDAQKEAGIINEKTAVSKLNKMVTEEFGITDKGAIAEIETFVNDWSYDTLADIPHMYNIDNDIDVSSVDERILALNHEALAYSKSASSAKSVENYVPYTDQLKNISKEDRDYIMGMGGIRKHSSNDFRMDYVQDYFLFYADLAAEGWTGHTYTKSADFTRIFACTNDRINMSIAFYEDSDGELRENLDEGASWKDVKELRKAYKNVGAMAMVTSDNQLSFALNADWIDMIIPFHASGLDKAVWYDLRMWNDYTSKQSERFFNAETMRQRLVEAGVEIPKNAKSSDIKTLFDETFQIKHIYGKKGEVLKPHFFPGDTYVNGQLVPGHHNDVDTYFKLCEEYGVHPRFYGIKVSDTNGNQVDVTEHPSYLKLIKETARTDSEQETIQFNFGNYDPLLKMTPFEYAMKRLQEEAKNGGFENTKADPYGVVDEFVNEYLDKDRPLGYLTERAKETRDILLEMSKEAAKQQADIVGQETEALSLSESGATPVSHSATEISGADVRLQTPENFAPVVESAQNTNAVQIEKHGQFYEIRGEIAEKIAKDLELKVFYRTVNGENVPTVGFPLRFLDTYNKKANRNGYSLVQNPLPDNLAPGAEQIANQQQTENISTITDADAPAEVEEPMPEQTTNVSTPKNPFDKRDYTKVGSTKTKSFVEENPDAQSFFQEAAQAMLGDLRNSQKGQRWYNDRLYYESGGENGLGGVQRETTQDIADLLDGHYHYSYQQIDDALERIINGEPLNACAKRIEFALNDRLMNGYTDIYGTPIPANQGYINLLNQMQTAEDINRQGAESATFTDADAPGTTDIAPAIKTATKVKAPVAEDVAPSKVTEAETEERVAQIRREDPKVKEGSFWSRAKKTINDAVTFIGDKGWAIENLSKKTKNRTIEALYDFYRNRTKGVAQEYIHDRLLPMWEKIEKTGKLEDFQLYAYHLHNIDRMSLDTPEGIARRKELRKVLEGYNERQIETIASKKITRNTKPDMVATIYAAQEYINLGGERGLNKAVFGDSVTAEDSRKAVAEYEANNPEFKGWEQEVLEYNKALREYAVQEGLISRKTANLWAKMYPHYVPISRHGKNGLSVNVPLDTRRTGVDSPFKRAKGGNSDFDPLFETMAKNTEQIFRAVQRNRFGIELMDTLEASYMMDAEKSSDKATRQAVLEGKIPAGTRVKAFDRNNIGTINSYNPKTGEYNVHFDGEHGSADANIDARLIAPLGKLRQTIAQNEDADADSILDSTDENESDGMVVEEGKNGMPASFTVFVKGKRVKFDISEEIYNAVKPVTGELAKTHSIPNTIAEGYKKLLTQYNPVFALWRNPIKDAKDVLFNSQHAGKTYLNVPEAFVNLTKGGKWVEEYAKNGGNSVTYYDSKKKIFKKQNKILDKVNVYGKATERIETLWRLAEYIASRKEGRSVEVSMLDAARVTTNFGAGGDLTKWANRNGAMFLNPSVQGAMQIGRNVREAHHQGAKGYAWLAVKVAAMGLPALVANWLRWDDDEDYQELSDYVKQNYFIIHKTEDGKFIRIPKGRAEAVIQYAFEKAEDLLTGDEELDMETLTEIVANGWDLAKSNLAPNNPFENNLISPISQVAKNETWYGEDLVPQRLQDLPANEQYDETTDEISKWFANTGLGKMLNVSPYKMNYLMQQYGGGLADTVLPMLTPEAENGSDSLLGNMIAPWKDEFVSDGVLKNQNVSDFYDLKDKLTVNANASTATDEDYLKSSYMNAINSELSELYARKREIQNDSSLSDSEKYEMVRDIQQDIVDLTREALNSYEDVNIQGSYATVGDVQYRYYTPGEDSTAEPGWRKLSSDQIRSQDAAINKLGITASEYWSNKEEYDYAVEKPEKYAVAKSVGGYKTFRNVSKDLYDIKADKDSSGKSISGSRKNKVLDYINGLDLDYGEKIILFKSEYNADDTYNWDIIDYLNSREDISYEEMETILKELGFEVSSDGTITWD